ncbi:MAG: hypothetical protein ACE5KE_15310 [Methanosarcinales archaeon]
MIFEILDSCVWIHAFLDTDEKCVSVLKKVLKGELKPIVSAYIAKEVLDNVIDEGRKCGKNVDLLQTAIWSIFREPFTKTIFTPIDFDKIVLKEVRSRPEYKALAKALGIESKDAPIVTLAYQYAVPLVTVDVKSLLNVRKKVHELIGVDIISVEEFLESL